MPNSSRPPVRRSVEGRLARELDRMPVGRHRHGGAEPDRRGMRAPPGEDLEGIGRDGHLERVVLGGPGDREAAVFGHLHHLERVARHLAHVDAVVHALQIDRELEFHAVFPPSTTAAECLSCPRSMVQRFRRGGKFIAASPPSMRSICLDTPGCKQQSTGAATVALGDVPAVCRPRRSPDRRSC